MCRLEKVVGLTGFVIIHLFIASFSPAQGERNQKVKSKFSRPVNAMPMSSADTLNEIKLLCKVFNLRSPLHPKVRTPNHKREALLVVHKRGQTIAPIYPIYLDNGPNFSYVVPSEAYASNLNFLMAMACLR